VEERIPTGDTAADFRFRFMGEYDAGVSRCKAWWYTSGRSSSARHMTVMRKAGSE